MTEPGKTGAAEASALILLSKTPGELPVKTRLAADLGSETAEALYRCFLAEIGTKCRGLNLPLRVHHLPGAPHEAPVFTELLGPAISCLPQQGEELGARMLTAFRQGFAAGYARLVLIGGDCPDLAPATLEAAFAALADQDCVLGPTADGGYYLLGFRRPGFFEPVFDFADWAAPGVYGETLRRLASAGVSYTSLPGWEDIDTLADLRRLWERNQSGWFAASQTMQALRRLWPHD